MSNKYPTSRQDLPISDWQCWHFCRECREEYFHILAYSITTRLDAYFKTCKKCRIQRVWREKTIHGSIEGRDPRACEN